MQKDFNPFLVSDYKGPAYFCDRENESHLLKKYIKNNLNVTLFAIRRIGKTGLIHHVFDGYKNNSKIACIYVDILGTRNLREFTNQLATAIYNRFPENRSIGKKVLNIIKLLRPHISYDPLSGSPEVSFELSETKQYEKTIEQLFGFLDKQKIHTVFAIDEFQQLLEYPETNTEALLRTHMQRLKNTRFIFCGSNQKMMHEIFNSAKRPFYASCTSMHLDFIDRQEYEKFITGVFRRYRRTIDKESISFVLEWTAGHTFYTQYLCNFLYASGLKKIGLSEAQKAAADILKLNENNYYQYRNFLTSFQWDLLTGIAKEGRLFKAYSKEFINNNRLGTSSMVTRGLASLLEKEIIYYNAGVKKPYYEVYDKFLMRWLQHF